MTRTDVQSCTTRGVYTALSKGARGILFPNNGDQRLPVEDRKDAEGHDAALSEERGKIRFFERMEDPVADRLPQAGEIMKDRLRLSAELVLIGLPKMSPIEWREIGVGVKRGENKGAFRMQRSMPLFECEKRRGDIGQ